MTRALTIAGALAVATAIVFLDLRAEDVGVTVPIAAGLVLGAFALGRWGPW